jgi:hypothetical protein
MDATATNPPPALEPQPRPLLDIHIRLPPRTVLRIDALIGERGFGAHAPAMREAMAEDWRHGKAVQDSWSPRPRSHAGMSTLASPRRSMPRSHRTSICRCARILDGGCRSRGHAAQVCVTGALTYPASATRVPRLGDASGPESAAPSA